MSNWGCKDKNCNWGVIAFPAAEYMYCIGLLCYKINDTDIDAYFFLCTS